MKTIQTSSLHGSTLNSNFNSFFVIVWLSWAIYNHVCLSFKWFILVKLQVHVQKDYITHKWNLNWTQDNFPFFFFSFLPSSSTCYHELLIFFYWLLFESASLWWCWQTNKLHSLVGLLHKLLFHIYFFIIIFRQLYVNNLHFFFWIRKEITCFIKNYLRSHTIDIDVHNDRQ